MNPDPRISILKELRDWRPGPEAPQQRLGYDHAAWAVFRAIESSAHPDELWNGSLVVAELTDKMPIGEHLAATRRFFGFVA